MLISREVLKLYYDRRRVLLKHNGMNALMCELNHPSAPATLPPPHPHPSVIMLVTSRVLSYQCLIEGRTDPQKLRAPKFAVSFAGRRTTCLMVTCCTARVLLKDEKQKKLVLSI